MGSCVQCQHGWLLAEQITERALKLQMGGVEELAALWVTLITFTCLLEAAGVCLCCTCPCSVPGTGSVLC